MGSVLYSDFPLIEVLLYMYECIPRKFLFTRLKQNELVVLLSSVLTVVSAVTLYLAC